jgi:hypothetical protein
MAALDVSVLAACCLAAVVLFWQNRRPSQPSNDAEGASASSVLEYFGVSFCSVSQVLPTVLLCMAAVSPWHVLYAVTENILNVGDLFAELTKFLDVDQAQNVQLGAFESLSEAPEWTDRTVDANQHLWIVVSLTLWQADKVHELLQRLIRYRGDIPANIASNPVGYSTSVAWGISRRVVVLVISTCGCVPFLKHAYPAIVLDDVCDWAWTKVEDSWNRKLGNICPIPMMVSLVLVPAFRFLRLLLLFVQLLLLGITAYPYYTSSFEASAVLVVSALAWTYFLWTKICDDWYGDNGVLTNAKMFWQLRFGGGGQDG